MLARPIPSKRAGIITGDKENKRMMNTVLEREKSVLLRVGVGRSTLWRMMRQGEFPKPVKIGVKSIAWPSSEVDAWIKARIADSRKEG